MKVFKIIMMFICAVALFVGGYAFSKSKGDYLNMNTVQTFEASGSGVLLITEDGSGYFIEK